MQIYNIAKVRWLFSRLFWKRIFKIVCILLKISKKKFKKNYVIFEVEGDMGNFATVLEFCEVFWGVNKSRKMSIFSGKNTSTLRKIRGCKVCKVRKVGLMPWYSLRYLGEVGLCWLCGKSAFDLIIRDLSELCNFAIAKLGIYLSILWTLQFKIAKWGSISANSNKFGLRSVCTHIVN